MKAARSICTSVLRGSRVETEFQIRSILEKNGRQQREARGRLL